MARIFTSQSNIFWMKAEELTQTTVFTLQQFQVHTAKTANGLEMSPKIIFSLLNDFQKPHALMQLHKIGVSVRKNLG